VSQKTQNKYKQSKKHNIPFQPLETKKQLYETIKFKKLLSVFKTDKKLWQEKPNHTYQSNPPHDYQRATVKVIKSFLSFGLLDSGGLLPFTTLYTEL
jgi:hypothetical protein